MVHGYGTPAQNKAMQDYLTRRYQYDFVITSKDSIEGTSARYADSNMYRFGIIYSLHTIPAPKARAIPHPPR